MVPVLVPLLRVNTTVKPPLVRSFPASSFVRRVSVATAPDANVEADTLTSERPVDAVADGETVMVGGAEVTEVPPMVAWIVVAVPARSPVKVAV